MILFGGFEPEYKSQISKVESCRLKRIGTLPIQFFTGACNSFKENV